MPDIPPTASRFTNRVADYAASRPGYPAECIDYLKKSAGLTDRAAVADIGSGTGIFTRLLAPHARLVYAVEPNPFMAESYDEYPNIRPVSGTASATTLPDGSVDLITCAQSFHWFDRASALAEFRRIARPGASLVLIWNKRRTDTPFLRAYEAALSTWSADYTTVNHANLTETELASCFAGPMSIVRFPNSQHFTRNGLKSRMLSSSYCPMPGEKNHDNLFAEVEAAFHTYAQNGVIAFEYHTEIYRGPIAPSQGENP